MRPEIKNDLIFLGQIIFIVAILSLAIYWVTGTSDNENQHTQTGGLPYTEEKGVGGWFGFSVDENALVYGVMLGALILLCLYTLFWWRNQG